ncbi:Protein C50B8.1 [Aphelenchoides avenae]|nr:Protein C50B8.1 [Aphelenchus avenae]
MRLALRLLTRVTKVADDRHTLYLTHLKWVTGKHQLKKHFSRYGEIETISMFYDEETGLHKGFAMLKFADARAAASAIQERPHVIDGDVIGCEFTVPIKAKEKFQEL